MIETTNFKTLLAQGAVGEAIVTRWANESGYDVMDVSGDPQYQALDIDFIMEKDGKQTLVECKLDNLMAKYGNVCLETVSNIATGRTGWINMTGAEFITIVDTVNCDIYVFKTQELRDHLCYGRVMVRDQMENGSYFKQAELTLVPLTCLEYTKYDY